MPARCPFRPPAVQCPEVTLNAPAAFPTCVVHTPVCVAAVAVVGGVGTIRCHLSRGITRRCASFLIVLLSHALTDEWHREAQCTSSGGHRGCIRGLSFGAFSFRMPPSPAIASPSQGMPKGDENMPGGRFPHSTVVTFLPHPEVTARASPKPWAMSSDAYRLSKAYETWSSCANQHTWHAQTCTLGPAHLAGNELYCPPPSALLLIGSSSSARVP